jgi:hypothetical protein
LSKLVPPNQLDEKNTNTPIASQFHDFRLIKIVPNEKIAIEKDWHNTKNYAYNDPELLTHIASGGNYAAIAGKDHVIIDTDTPELQQLIERLIGQQTFTVLTPGHKTKQFYLQVKWNQKESRKTTPLFSDPKDSESNIGHVKSGNSYGLGPGCTHPDGGKYTVADDIPIVEITENHFNSILEGLTPYIANRAYDDEKKLVSQNSVVGQFDITRIIPNLSEFKRQGNEYQGSHPVHGSTTGKNFRFNLEKEVWYCFRCLSGGGSLQLLAVLEGLIPCNQAQPGVLRGELFKKVLKIAQDKKLLPEDADVAKARELAKDPVTFIRTAQEALETKLAGEYKNRMFMVLAGVSRNIKTTIVRIYGPNSVGKKMLYCWMSDLFGSENVVIISSATAAWLKRRVMQGFQTKGKIFILIEDRGDPNDQLRYQFEQIYSEDKIRLGLTVKGDGGEWEAVDVELEGPLTFITTSTELEQSYHAQTRAWEVNPDESPEQSRRIAKWYRWRHLRPIKALEQEKKDLSVVRTYLTTLPTFKRIIIPYIDKIKFEYQNLADRRKLPDFTSLLETITHLFSELCPKDLMNNILFSAPFVFDIASAIAGDIIAVSRGDLNRGEERVWKFIQDHFDEIKSVTREGRKPQKDNEIAEAFVVSDLCPARKEFADIHENTMRNWLNGIARKGHIQKVGTGRGKPAIYLPVHNNRLVNSNRAKPCLIPELDEYSESDFEITSSQIYEGMAKPPLHPTLDSYMPVGSCELVNYRIKPEQLEFNPKWQESKLSSSQTKICDPLERPESVEHEETKSEPITVKPVDSNVQRVTS